MLFCHGTPRSEAEVFTRLTPEGRLASIFERLPASVVACGHNNYLGLYDASGELEDEARLGAFPVELVSWDADSIVLRSRGTHGDPRAHREYVSAFASRASHLGPYRLRVLVD